MARGVARGTLPTGIRITSSGTSYDFQVNAYEEFEEAAIVRQPGIVGSSFTAQRDARPEILTWKLDDWSQGEGVKVFDSTRDYHSRMYDTSTAALDVSVPGKVTLGLSTTTSKSAVDAANSGPFLAVSNGNPWLVYEGSAQERTTSPDTWTSRTTGITRAKGVEVYGSFLYIGEHSGNIRKVDSSSNTQFSSTSGHAPIAAQARLFSFNFASSTLKVYEYDFGATLPTAGTVRGTLSGGLPSLDIVSPPVSYGPRFFFVVQPPNEDARLYIYDGIAVTERRRFPKGFRLYDTTHPVRSLAVLNDTIFVAGSYAGTTNTAAVQYLYQDTAGELGRIRQGTSIKAISCHSVTHNELLIGCDNGQVFRYDMATGGMSLFADFGSTWLPYDIVWANGFYYYGLRKSSGTTANVRVDRSTTSYVSSSAITHPVWDFDYPAQDKLAIELEIKTETMPANTSVDVSLLLDDTTTVTTDINGDPLTHSSGSSTKFVLNNTFKTVKPTITLNGGTNTPTLLSVTMRATSKSKVSLYRVELDLESETPTERIPARQVSGKMLADWLRTIRDTGGVFSIAPYFIGEMNPKPGPTASSVNVFVSNNPDHNPPFWIGKTKDGRHVARLVMQAV